MHIVQFPNPVLTEVARPLEFKEYVDPLIQGMQEIIMASWRRPPRAVGLAAPQVGHSKRLFMMMPASTMVVCINPEIISSSETLSTLEEGCMSIPGFKTKVTRPTNIEVKYYNARWELIHDEYQGTYARIFQHELDHLNGKLINV